MQNKIFTKYKKSVHDIKRLCRGESIVSGDKKMPLLNYIKRPENSLYDNCVNECLTKNHSHESIFTAETDIKYEGYVRIENMRVAKIKKMEHIKIPNKFNYNTLPNLSLESKEKLIRVMPETLGQASRIAGVRPADVGVLAIFMKSNP